MSSWKNANKTRTRTHRERGQVESRAHLGHLEKKKDYRLRADDHHRKAKTLKLLKQKALDKNPDEFYFNMVNTVKKDGVHERREKTEPEHTEAQLKLMFSQDLKYVNMKRSTELKKIERLKSSLHLIDCDDKPKNKHTVFVDSKKEVKQFDAAKYFKTHPSLVSRTYNRPKLETLKSGELSSLAELGSLEELSNERKKKYKELKKRIEREKELSIIAQKMERKKQLTDTKSEKTKLSAETKDAPAQYKWTFQRKR